MMKKRLLMLAGLLALALTLTACASQENQAYYETAQLYLGCGDYDDAAELFAQLGEYEDSAEYALYSRALQALAEEDFALARANLEAVNPFKSSGRYLMLLDAISAEENGDPETALALYGKLGTFADAHKDVQRLQTEIPEAALKEGRALMSKGEYAAAREIFLALEGYGASETLAENCTTALNKAAYTEADQLFDAGDHLNALSAFRALGDTLDAAERAGECLAALHKALEERSAAATLSDVPALLADYAALGEDDKAQQSIAALTERFGRNIDLVAMEQPVVALGMYPAEESGAEQPVLWRVIRSEGAALTLLCERVLDAADAEQVSALRFTEKEQSAVGEATLPAVTDLAALPELRCRATPYALAQGVTCAEDAAAYWLRDSLENGLHPVIGTDGALTLPGEGVVPGVRPMITLSLERFMFTDGSGTEEDPFRAE